MSRTKAFSRTVNAEYASACKKILEELCTIIQKIMREMQGDVMISGKREIYRTVQMAVGAAERIRQTFRRSEQICWIKFIFKPQNFFIL